jgi:hypothetical protein
LKGFKELGSYHFVFWNCQLFAKLLLRLICEDGESIDFGARTAAETSRLVSETGENADVQVLCAIVIPSPIATTQWHMEVARTKRLISRVQKSPEEATKEELVEITEQGANYIVFSALTDPENEARIEQLVEPKRGKDDFMHCLMADFFRGLLKLIGLAK